MNETRSVVLAERAEVARSAWSRMVGLLGRGHAHDGLWIEPCTSIHTFFMGFAIDAVFIDRGGWVLHVEHALAPWRMTRFVRGARAVLELDAGAAAGTAQGDRLVRTPCA